MGERYCEGIEVLELLDKEVVMGVAVTRSISHGKAYSEYSQKKDENGVITATFVGAKNMVGNTDLIFDNVQLDDMWMEMKEAGRDYVRKGKDVTRDIIAIEWSPTSNESEGWTTDDWFKHAEELIAEIDKVQLKKGKRDPKTKEWILDENGNKKMFDVPQTDLSHSKWLAYLHTDAKSGIPHLHIMISRYCADGKTLNCDTDIAKKGAQASEALNEKYGWTKAMDIRQQHIGEINGVINAIMDDMDGDRIDFAEFERRVKASTFTDYKGRTQHYDFQFHRDAQGNVDGYSVMRGHSKFTADQLGQKIVNIADDRRAEIKDAIYDVLREMDTPKFDWNKFVEMMQRSDIYQVDLKRDSKGNVVRYDVKCGGRTYNASQIGANVTARKIAREWERIRREKDERIRQRTATKAKPVQDRPAERKPVEHSYVNKGQTKAERERLEAISDGRKAIREFLNMSWARHFTLRATEDVLPAAVAARAIDMSQTPDGWREPGAFEAAARDIVGFFELDAEMAAQTFEGVMGAVIDMALPPATPSVGGGGGGGNNDLPKKKDDDWEWWKKNGLTNKQRRGQHR